MEKVKFYIVTFELMNRHSGINDNNNNDKKNRTKQATTTAIPMVGAIVTAALLLSGLSLISSYQQPAIAQQNMTGGAGGNATTAAGGGNATTAAGGGNQTTAEVMLHLEEVRTAIENDDDEAALMHLDLAIMALGGNATTGGATNATAAAEGTTAEGEGGTSAADDYGCPPDPDA